MNTELSLLNYFCGLLVQRGHRLNGSIDPRRLRFSSLDRSRNHSRAERLSEEESIARLGAGVGENFFRMDESGHSVSKLRFIVANAVAADHEASGLDHL